MRSMRSVASWTTDLPYSKKQFDTLWHWLDDTANRYNDVSFIADDPISVPHRYTTRQDIEIAGFFASIMAWGQRKTIVSKATALMELMDHAPHAFIRDHQEHDRKRFLTFTHRTLQSDDVLFLVSSLQHYYRHHESLEEAFTSHMSVGDEDVFNGLAGFYDQLFDQPWVLERTRKHIATPVRKSSCKRLNMYLRWMVRSDDRGVDFGLWKKINPAQLIIPLDLHVGQTARRLQLLRRDINDWQAAKELTVTLKHFDPADPVRYDFALFGSGINP